MASFRAQVLTGTAIRTESSLALTEKLAYPLSANTELSGSPRILPASYIAEFLESFSYSNHRPSNIYLWFMNVNPFSKEF